MDRSIKIFQSPNELAEKLSEELMHIAIRAAGKKRRLTIALSGGSTPGLLFAFLGDHFSKSVPWENVHFFWVDERCVPPDDSDSNYGMTKVRLFDKISIPDENIHRIKGEDDPEKESDRYSGEISDSTLKHNGLPRFDIILLGLGEDGHIASVFPGSDYLFNSKKICVVTVHPVTRQNRITMTGGVINNAGLVVFLVTGKKKSEIVEKIINKNPSSIYYPASNVVPLYGKLIWYLDNEAAQLL